HARHPQTVGRNPAQHAPALRQAAFVVTFSRRIDGFLSLVRGSQFSFSNCMQREKLPMNATMRRISALAACLVVGIVAVWRHAETRAAGSAKPKAIAAYLDQPKNETVNSWDQKAAAVYLDQRAGWWMEWPKAARDHQTFCVSCHTAVPYALSRPALRKALTEEAPS